jgi:hypothetical protein
VFVPRAPLKSLDFGRPCVNIAKTGQYSVTSWWLRGYMKQSFPPLLALSCLSGGALFAQPASLGLLRQ